MDTTDYEAQYFILDNRLSSFQRPQPVSKAPASTAANSRAPKALSWPHKSPAPIDLARAGFFYSPQPSNPDNVKCFLCHKDLDGWEEDDDPLQEHLKHSGNCGWAICAAVELELGDVVNEDPRLPYLLEARKSTFAGRWPYESKKGWKCKTKQLAEAGWQYTPTLESDDNTTCAYCQLALDGWEASDKPMDEHQRRSPNCAFFILSSKFPAPKKAARSKGARASKVSRLSVQSVATAASDVQSNADPEESMLSTASALTQGGRKAPKGRKPAAPSAASKARKTRVKKDEPIPVAIHSDFDTTPKRESEAPAPKPARGKKRTSEEMDTTNADPPDAPAPKKRVRGKASTAHIPKEEEPAPSNYAMFDPVMPEPDDAAVEAELRALEQEMKPEAAPQELQVPKKGRKAAGTRKVSKQTLKKKDATETVARQQQPGPVENTAEDAAGDAPIQPDFGPAPADVPEPEREPESEPEPAPKQRSKTAKVKKVVPPVRHDADDVDELHEASSISISSTNATVRGAATEPAPVKRGRGRPSKKSLEARLSAGTSAPTITPDVQLKAGPPAVRETYIAPPELPAVATTAPQPAVKKPSQTKRALPPLPPPPPPQAQPQLQPQPQPQPQSPEQERSSPDPPATPHTHETFSVGSAKQAVPSPSQSPQSSDAENQPPSSKPSTSAAASRMGLAPVPIPATTPVRTESPSKRNMQIGGLRSAVSWTAVDVESIFDTDKANANVLEDLIRPGTELTTPEKNMTVEEFILHNAKLAERQLKEECEAMVSVFERQGTRAMEVLEALVVDE